MSRGPRVVVVLAVLLAVASAVGARMSGPPEDAPDARTRAREILSDARFQTELPDGCDGRCGSGGSSWSGSGGRREVGTRESAGAESDADPGGSDAMRALRFPLLAAGVVALLVMLARSFGQPSPDVSAPATPAVADAPATTPVAPPPADDLEALLAAGRHAEAAHRLLLDTLDALGRARRLRWPGSMTAREVGDALALGDPERGRLGVLLGTVERNLFGGRPVTVDDWERCLRAAESLHGRAGRADAPA